MKPKSTPYVCERGHRIKEFLFGSLEHYETDTTGKASYTATNRTRSFLSMLRQLHRKMFVEHIEVMRIYRHRQHRKPSTEN